MKLLQTILDAFHYTRKGIVTFIVYISLRLYGSELTLKQLWNVTFDSSVHTDRHLNEATSLDLLLDESKTMLDRAEARRNLVTDKCKALLTETQRIDTKDKLHTMARP